VSAVPEFTDALVAQLTTLFPNAQVCDGDPIKLTDNIVSVGDSSSTEEPNSLSPSGRWEVIDIQVTIACATGGSDAKPSRDAAYTMLDSLRTYLRTTDRTVGGSVLGNAGIVNRRYEQGVGTMGRWATIEATVRAYAEVS
jgi:hypothetical protein